MLLMLLLLLLLLLVVGVAEVVVVVEEVEFDDVVEELPVLELFVLFVEFCTWQDRMNNEEADKTLQEREREEKIRGPALSFCCQARICPCIFVVQRYIVCASCRSRLQNECCNQCK
jgi:hypothetical protein